MQRIKNPEGIILQLKSFLKNYLEKKDTFFKGSLFTCPNRKEHSNNDNVPSAGFIPNTDEQVWHCFSCGKSGDIFTAYSLLEDKNISGANWFFALKILAELYQIPYELEPLTKEEESFTHVQEFLKTLVVNANRYLVKNHPKKVMEYLNKREWVPIIEHFELGYLPPGNQGVKKYIIDSFKKYPELKINLAANMKGEGSEEFFNGITDRLIYPIKHRYGYILGIVDRAISDDDKRQKYVKHFIKITEKKGVVFNLNKTFKTVYLVEGASSVFTLYKNGVKNAISSLGTAFSDQTYQELLKNNIEKLIVCFDGDAPGQKALLRAIEVIQNKSDIKVYAKILDNEKDPDDFIKEFGIEKFKNIPEISIFKFQLDNYLKNENNDKYKKSLYEIIISTKDGIIREKMFKLFSKEVGILKTTLIDEVAKYEKTKGIISDVGVAEVLKEETSLIELIETFEEKAWRSGRLKGIATGFPIFDNEIDGLQTGLVLVAGRWNVGKSAFLQSLALNLLNDPTNYVLYFSIDDPVIHTTIPRFVANLSRIPINTVSNPLYRIDKNETLDEEIKKMLKERRFKSIETLKSYAKRLGIKDSTDGYNTAFVEKIIKIYKVLAQDKKLIIFVDFLNMIDLAGVKKIDRTELETQLAGFFKRMAGLYDIPVVCTVEGTKGVTETVMHEKDIKGSSSLQFRSDLTLLLSSDFESSGKSNMFFYDDQGEPNPIVEVRVAKNKMSGFKKAIYYKFYKQFSRYEECTILEQQEYRRKS